MSAKILGIYITGRMIFRQIGEIFMNFNKIQLITNSNWKWNRLYNTSKMKVIRLNDYQTLKNKGSLVCFLGC